MARHLTVRYHCTMYYYTDKQFYDKQFKALDLTLGENPISIINVLLIST